MLEAFLKSRQQHLFECVCISNTLLGQFVDLLMQLALLNVLGLAPHEELEALVEELWGVLTYEGLQVVSELRVVQEVCGEGVGVRVD